MNIINEIKEKINFRQPKYAIPAIIYIPMMFTGYFLVDIFNTKAADIPDSTLQSTEYLNPVLPGAKVKGDGITGKYESMLKSYGKIDDYSAVGNIDRDEDTDKKEEYESKYTDEDIAKMDEGNGNEAMERLKELQNKTELSSRKSNAIDQQTYTPSSAEERQRQAMEELQKVIAQARLKGQNTPPPAVYDTGEDGNNNDNRPDAKPDETSPKQVKAESKSPSVSIKNGNTGSVESTADVSSKSVKAIDETQEAEEVVKKVHVTSDYFNTIAQNEPEQKLIKAIIDENVKATDGSRVRLRLLDDIEINGVVVPKGSYLYATMSGFGSQRAKGEIKSILVDDELIKICLSIYDTDGMEGLYIPKSHFGETSKDVASGAMSANGNINTTTTGSSLTQWGMQAVSNAYSKTSSAISKAIKKKSAKLKYGTFVYLVNTKENRNK